MRYWCCCYKVIVYIAIINKYFFNFLVVEVVMACASVLLILSIAFLFAAKRKHLKYYIKNIVLELLNYQKN